MKFPNTLLMLKREHLTQEQKEIFDCIGKKSYCKLIENFGGTKITIPKTKSIRLLIKDFVFRFYDVSNKKFLSEHLQISPRHLQEILLRSYSIAKEKPTLNGKVIK